MNKTISEPARQLYDTILKKGFVSPDNTWEQFSILDLLQVTNGDSYKWLRELEREGLIKKTEATHFSRGPTFYAVPPFGYRSAMEPGHMTILNYPSDFANRDIEPKMAVGELKSPIHVNVSPVFNNSQQSISTGAGDTVSRWGTLATWVGVIVAIVAIFVALRIAGKI